MRSFPADLARTQQEWSAIYRQLAERPGRTELRRRLHRLSAQLFFHPYWQQRRPRPAEWWELRDLGRRGDDVRERSHS
ncbi:hypothetical protein [Streptomyces canus]|uniref:hypothetical protein n=1 Tax=Streptomyces canus TaxID=58343 RepID=UPI0003798916|nr:hypothetical protein [Streptomyces canus]